jgi:hypothetical protein
MRLFNEKLGLIKSRMDTKYESVCGDGKKGEKESEQKCTQKQRKGEEILERKRRHWEEKEDIGRREKILEKERRCWRDRGDKAVNSTKNRHVGGTDTTHESRCTVKIQYAIPQRSQNWAARPSRRVDQIFEGTAAVGKAWFANNSKGSEVGLSMGEARLRPLSSIGTEGEQEGERREQWRCNLSRS